VENIAADLSGRNKQLKRWLEDGPLQKKDAQTDLKILHKHIRDGAVTLKAAPTPKARSASET
jgi:hypothetical protein